MKSSYGSWRDTPPIFGSTEGKHAEDVSSFFQKVTTHLTSLLGPQDFWHDLINLQDLVESYFNAAINDSKPHGRLHSEMQSAWSLLTQVEYVMLRSLQEASFIPKLYGSCGHIYVVEFVGPAMILHPPGHFFDSEGGGMPYSEDWEHRAQAAVQLLDLLRELKTKYRQHLHHCDITNANLGFGADGSFKLIDIDLLLFDSTLRSLMRGLQTEACQSHRDCDGHPGCRGKCDKSRGKCTGEKGNTDLQVYSKHLGILRYTLYTTEAVGLIASSSR